MLINEKTRQCLEKIHRKQILGIDLDIIAMVIFSYYLSITFKKNYLQIFIGVLIVSIIIHKTLGINTRINEVIFGNLTKK